MWKCPKCGRMFRNMNQHHFCGKAPESVDAYIAEQGEDIRDLLEEVRRVISEALPEATERMAWQMPTYRGKTNLIHFAAQKNHLGLYPGEEAVAHFAEELRGMGVRFAKGSIRFPYASPMPIELIQRIAAWVNTSK